MAETGWPLIPRELLPAPVKPARRSRRQQAQPDGGRQLAMFGAETTEPSPADLAGLLAGPGRLGRMGGTARVSVRVDAAWRVHVLVAELVSRGLVVNWLPIEEPGYGEEPPPADEEEPPAPTDLREPDGDEPWVPDVDDPWTGDGEPWADEPKTRDGTDAGSADQDDVRPGAESLRSRTDDDDVRAPAEAGQPATAEDDAPVRPRGVAAFEVRTAYSSRLNALARGWPPAADRLFLSGPGLRLWVAAAGEPRPGGYSLGFGPDSDRVAVDAALSRAGLAGVVSDAGRRYLISGRKRLARLAELVGERPDAAPPRLWPGGAGA